MFVKLEAAFFYLVSFSLQWISLPFFLVHRLIVTGYNFAWLIYTIYKYQAKLFIFLRNLTYLILNIYVLLASFDADPFVHSIVNAGSNSRG